MKNVSLEPMKDGEIYELPASGGWFQICCDCGLVHFHLLEKGAKGWVLRAWRDTLASENFRRSKGLKGGKASAKKR